MPWIPRQEEREEELQEVKTQTQQQCEEGMYREEDLCKDKEEEDREIYAKLSATLATKRDI